MSAASATRLIAAVFVLLAFTASAQADEPPLYVDKPGTVLRARPGIDGRVLASIPQGTQVRFLGERSEVQEIDGETGRWAQIQWGDRTGWVFDRYLSFTRPLSADKVARLLARRRFDCGRAHLRLEEDGTGKGAVGPDGKPETLELRNVRWWGSGPFYAAFEEWRGPAQEALALCELEYNDAREVFDVREVDLRRRVGDTLTPLGLASECAGKPVAEDGCSPLHRAVVAGRLEEVDALLKGGASPDAVTHWGWTALHHASWSGQAAIARRLLDGGANQDAKGHDGSSPLHLAAGQGRLAVAALLVERKAVLDDLDRDGRSALHYAADQGHKDVIALLLERGLAADLRDHFGWTALGYAARRGHLDALEALLARKADPNLRDRDDATALHAAAADCQLAAVERLLAHGADPALRDRFGLKPLHHALFARCQPIPAGLGEGG